MKLVRILTAVFAMFLSYGAYAGCKGNVEIEYGVKTIHLISDRDTVNEDNKFTAATVNCWHFARFINSYGHLTYTAGRTISITDNLALGFGLINGYGVNAKNFPEIFRIGDEFLWYIEPEVKLWANNVGINTIWADNVGVKTRLLGEVWQSSLTARIEF